MLDRAETNRDAFKAADPQCEIWDQFDALLKAFLADLAAAKVVWESQVAPGLNDLRSKGLECAGLEHAAWRACIADAECRGVSPDCGPEPSLEGPGGGGP